MLIEVTAWRPGSEVDSWFIAGGLNDLIEDILLFEVFTGCDTSCDESVTVPSTCVSEVSETLGYL